MPRGPKGERAPQLPGSSSQQNKRDPPTEALNAWLHDERQTRLKRAALRAGYPLVPLRKPSLALEPLATRVVPAKHAGKLVALGGRAVRSRDRAPGRPATTI
jgi:hypothetical protein